MNYQNVIELPLSFRFSKQQLADMFRLQMEANDVMDGTWREATISEIPYYRASFIESAEAIGHFGYKWWKRTSVDKSQVKMELIDILHFALSDAIRQSNGASPEAIAHVDALRSSSCSAFLHEVGRWANGFDFLDSCTGFEYLGNMKLHYLFENTEEQIEVLDYFTFNDICEQLAFATLRDGHTDMALLFAAFQKIDMSPNEVHGLYVGKNVLNKFRTAKGQRTHDYCKIWDGLEDNEHLSEYLETQRSLGVPVTISSIYQFLEDTYAQVKNLEKR